MAKNTALGNAQKKRDDEYYTRYVDVENEMKHYNFEGRIVYCNCDNYEVSMFVQYFKTNFDKLRLKGLVATCYCEGGRGIYYEYESDGSERFIQLEGDGSFGSEECLNVLKQVDVVVTNPPFSLFRDMIDLLEKYNKQYVILGHIASVTYKNIFYYLYTHRLWLGVDNYRSFTFDTPSGKPKKIPVLWITNMEHGCKPPFIELSEKYEDGKYAKYDNYDAIEVPKVSQIPIDYDGVMGVPSTFLKQYNSDQFEIVGWTRRNNLGMDGGLWTGGATDAEINGKAVFRRILIRHKR